MFFSKRSLVAVVGVGLGLIGCGGNPEAAPEGSASAAKSQATLAPPPKKIDPVITKSSRLENCVYGALALKQARDAYLASTAGGEPAADKIPNFGFELPDASKVDPTAPPASTAAGSAAPAVKGSGAATAKPAPAPTAKTTAAPTAKATTTAAASAAAKPPTTPAAPPVAGSGSAGRPTQADIAKRMGPQLPFSRLIQGCKQAGNAKDMVAADLDPVLKSFQEYAQPLATTLQEASAYYSKEGYKEDAFAKGKEYHKTLTDGFAKLDDELKKLKDAADKWQKANPIDKAGQEESQKLGEAGLADATAVLLAFDAKPLDMGKVKEAVTKLEGSFNALKAYGEANKDKRDPWATAMVPPLSSMLEAAKGLAEKPADQVKPAGITNIIALWDRVQKQSYSAVQRKSNEGAARGMGPTQRMTKPRAPGQHAPPPQ